MAGNRTQIIETFLGDLNCEKERSCTPKSGWGGGKSTYLYFHRATMWNYGDHYLIAHKEGRRLLVNSSPYSMQTKKHIWEITGAARNSAYQVLSYLPEHDADTPCFEDVVRICEHNLRDMLKHCLKGLRGSLTLGRQIATLTDLKHVPLEFLEGIVPEEVREYVEESSGRTWVNYLVKQTKFPLLRDLARYAKEGRTVRSSALRPYLGEVLVGGQRSTRATRYLQRVKVVGEMVAALEISPLDGGHTLSRVIGKAA